MATTADLPIKTLKINEFTGNEPEPDDNDRYFAWKIARRHNTAVPLAQEEEQAWNAYTVAEEAAEQAWQALDSAPTSDWAATHHRWVKAEHSLDAAAGRWQSAAAAMDRAWDEVNWGDRAYDFYNQVLRQTGIRALMSANRPASHYSLQTQVQQRRREREKITKKTLALLAT
ncbi:hypothetical protein ACGFJC_47350 [Nonomuraea fuscirosea]|uniref:hypothetical protein n=1 Tax=Nonomuraea fuscirosea TaxID=1291556 RepID=UPI00371ED69A